MFCFRKLNLKRLFKRILCVFKNTRISPPSLLLSPKYYANNFHSLPTTGNNKTFSFKNQATQFLKKKK